jgi:Uracil phosphoribosyltransferase
VYEKLPADIAERHVLLMDPILGCGASAERAIEASAASSSPSLLGVPFAVATGAATLGLPCFIMCLVQDVHASRDTARTATRMSA